MKNKIIPSITLTAICLVVAVLLASVNMLTAKKIHDNNDSQSIAALTEVLPGGDGFVDIEITPDLPPSIDMVKKSSNGGYVFRSVVSGKNSGMIVMVGVNARGLITGTKCTASKETVSYADKVFNQTESTGTNDGWYVGMGSENLDELLVAGSTLTSKAYATAVKDALAAYYILSYGSYSDQCNAALGTSGIEFTEWFKTESISATVYYSENAGTVMLIDNTYVGIKDGAVVTEGIDEEIAALALYEYEIYKNTSITEVNCPQQTPTAIDKVYKTTGGNYLFMLNASGWGIDGDPDFASGEYIKIKLVIDSEGKILSIATLSVTEGDGYDGVCSDPEYYEGFVGAGEASLGSIGNIAGATITSQGYKNALKEAFELYEILTGGNG